MKYYDDIATTEVEALPVVSTRTMPLSNAEDQQERLHYILIPTQFIFYGKTEYTIIFHGLTTPEVSFISCAM